MRQQTRLLILFAVLFGSALVTRYYLSYKSERELVADITADLRNVVQAVHFSTHRFSSEEKRDKEALMRFVAEAKERNRALKEISIVNIHQEIVASSDSARIGERQPDIWQRKIAEGRFHEEDTLDWYEIVIPITKDQQVIGQVHASVLLSDASQMLDSLNRTNVLISFILFVSISVIFFLAVNRLGGPLRQLSAAARQVATGDLNVKVDVRGSDEVAEVAAAFNTMTSRLAQQRDLEDRIREMERRVILAETAASLAHEIRNPLNLINLTAGHLAHQFAPAGEKGKQEYFQHIESLKSQVQHLNNMVTDFLAIGKPLTLRKTTFPVSELFSRVEPLVKQPVVAKQISLELEDGGDVQITADIEQMVLVLLNLVVNAVEVCPAGSRIGLRGHLDGRHVTISVRDNGPGVEVADLERIFEPYYGKRRGGTGLGLTLARRIVEEHGGMIRAENVTEGGARFTITMPSEG